jgi:transglutaminase-like putative cysteine protease
VVGPRLDARGAWIDYEGIAASLGSSTGVRFDFDHRYGPLRWPRDGRELFRVRAPGRSYWKVANLDVFDGVRWVHGRGRFGAALADELPLGYRRRRAWNQRLLVTVRALSSRDLVGAGTTLYVRRPPSAAVTGPAPGSFVFEEPLRRGDSYVADVYVPRPSATQLEAAGTGYPALAQRYLELTIPGSRPPGAERVVFAPWGSGGGASVAGQGGSASEWLRSSPYGRAWALAQRLAARSRTPYEYTLHVLGHLSSGFAYYEAPGRRRYPLESFLFDDRAGYCQQFAGAMALLLRMGGVPARAVGGFSPGSYSRSHREWVIRDLDAHSWVEAYFPGYGWVTFDPTPIAAPARSQFGYVPLDVPQGNRRGGRLAGGDRPEPGPRDVPPAPPAATWAGWRGLALLALAAGLVAAAAVLRRRRRTRRAPADPALAELERALRRAGSPASPDTTLRRLERRFAHEAGAAEYLAALRTARFGHGATPPSATQRRALRRALAQEGGAPGRARALWALPPRLPARRGHRTSEVPPRSPRGGRSRPS